jgi:hypothetical protein
MRGVGIGLTVMALLYYAFLSLSPLERLSVQASSVLAYQAADLKAKLEYADKNHTLPEGGAVGLDEMRSEQTWISVELKRREFRVNGWMPAVGVAGLALLLLSFLRISKTASKKREVAAAPTGEESIGVFVGQPRETYSDEWEYERQREGGFISRDEAINWMRKDPLKKCEYCGGEMRPTNAGQREGVELVTFYKKVPEGARDLRVVLGSYWFVKAASELKCVGCERVVRR